MKRLIVFLIRRRLGLKKGEWFRFANQNSPADVYYFTDHGVVKLVHGRNARPSRVSLNWLLDDECVVRKV